MAKSAAFAPLPSGSSKPYILPSKRETKAMTIAVAVSYGWGVVLCSDKLITHGNIFSHYEKKTEFFNTSSDSSIAICGTTDDFEAMRSVVQNIRSRFNASTPDRNPLIKDVLEEELNRMYSKPLATAPLLELLIAETKSEGLDDILNLYKTSGPHVTMANEFECVGIGDTSLVRYVADSLYDPKIPPRDAIALGIYLVQLAKKYMPQYVGGDTDVLNVAGGTCMPIDGKEIESVEDQFDKYYKTCFKKLLDRGSNRVS